MRILFSTAHKYLPQMRGGMQLTVHQLCQGLRRRGHDVGVLAGLMPGGRFAQLARVRMKANSLLRGCKVAKSRQLGYPVWYAWHPWEAVAHVVTRVRPDVIVVPAHLSVRMALAARATGSRVAMLLQDVEFDNHGDDFRKLGMVDCIANSHFTAGRYRERFGVDPVVIHPFIDPAAYRTESRRVNVTFINPHPKKGRDIAIEIARRLPAIPFVFVEAWPLAPGERAELAGKLARVPNIRFLPRQDDMRAVYADCKILLAPSVWEEAYGRVATEAQFSAIPVVASNRGGLPEAVGAGGVLLDPEQPIEDWVATIDRLWDGAPYYDQFAKAAKLHAARPEIAIEKQIDCFETFLKNVGATMPGTAVSAGSASASWQLPPHGREPLKRMA